jgi:hypothetical protein
VARDLEGGQLCGLLQPVENPPILDKMVQGKTYTALLTTGGPPDCQADVARDFGDV